jgi:HAD superfamily hydrolase (TIGR01549 family)
MTRAADRLSGRPLRCPAALLLDFGGVVVTTGRNPGWEMRLAMHIREQLDAAGLDPNTPSVEGIARDIAAGCAADAHWKDAMSRPFAPRELTRKEFWSDFVAADWPTPARALVAADADDLCRRLGHLRSWRKLRNGISAVLDAAAAAKVPVGIVSNALSGQVHLDFLEEHHLADRFAVIVHSDAAGVRKPNPEMILIATRQLGIAPADAWYVGDNFDRDVLCGVRAGVGGNILMEAARTWDAPYELDVRADAIVAGPAELLALFQNALRERAA